MGGSPPLRASRECISPPPKQGGAVGPWALGQPPKQVQPVEFIHGPIHHSPEWTYATTKPIEGNPPGWPPLLLGVSPGRSLPVFTDFYGLSWETIVAYSYVIRRVLLP